ncbi:hypothetical protein Tco_0765111 [Tanacetum coccineum]
MKRCCFTMKDGNPAKVPTSNKHLGSSQDGYHHKMSKNYFWAHDLKKAQDHSQKTSVLVPMILPEPEDPTHGTIQLVSTEVLGIHYEDGNPARAYIKQALGTFKDGDGNTLYQQSVKAFANSDIIFFFTSAQDGNRLLDDKRLSLADDLKKAHDHNQNKSK